MPLMNVELISDATAEKGCVLPSEFAHGFSFLDCCREIEAALLARSRLIREDSEE